jgi:hypothetical protein
VTSRGKSQRRFWVGVYRPGRQARDQWRPGAEPRRARSQPQCRRRLLRPGLWRIDYRDRTRELMFVLPLRERGEEAEITADIFRESFPELFAAVKTM